MSIVCCLAVLGTGCSSGKKSDLADAPKYGAKGVETGEKFVVGTWRFYFDTDKSTRKVSDLERAVMAEANSHLTKAVQIKPNGLYEAQIPRHHSEGTWRLDGSQLVFLIRTIDDKFVPLDPTAVSARIRPLYLKKWTLSDDQRSMVELRDDGTPAASCTWRRHLQ